MQATHNVVVFTAKTKAMSIDTALIRYKLVIHYEIMEQGRKLLTYRSERRLDSPTTTM